MTIQLLKRSFFLLMGAALLYQTAGAQSGNRQSDSAALHRELAALDSIIFRAFNACDSLTLESYFSEDLEFYHDIGGLTVTPAKTFASIRDNCRSGNWNTVRALLPGSLQVYPLNNYGAIQTGVHRFYQKGREAEGSTYAKFVHVWQKTGSGWKITRVLSYDHRPGH